MLRHGVQLGQTLMTISGWNADIVVTPPTWRVRIVRWLFAVSVMCAVYEAYALLVVPLIEPGPGAAPTQVADTESSDSGDAHPELAALFPEGSWERGRPMVLSTQWGKLLFREYRPKDDGRLELVPCTIVFYAPAGSKDKPGARRAVVLQAPDKAVLSFSGPLNLTRAEFTKLKGARLEGEVKIWSRETAPGADDALSITTRNVQILPQQIWTAHEVSFTYGPNRGTGRDLSIAISPAGAGAAPTKDALAQNLESLELAHVEQLTLQVPNRGMLSDLMPGAANAAGSPPPASAPDRPLEVNVTCDGPFRLDFRKSVASLEDHVEITHNNLTLPSDQLSADRLLIYFEAATAPAPPAAEQPAAATPAESRPLAQKVTVRRVEAHGMPATLRVPSVAVMARSQELSYDFQTRRILLLDEQNASLSYGNHQVEAPRLEYEVQAEPKRLGRLWATGPGIYQGQLGDEPEQRLTARWCGVLELQPQDGLHVLSIVQGANFSWNDMGTFTADELYVWLAEVSVPAPADAQQRPSTAAGADLELLPALTEPASTSADAAPAPAPRTRLEIRPVKMLAQGNVHADSPQFQGQTPRLEVWFDHPNHEGAASSDTGAAGPASDPAGDASSPIPGTGKDTDKKLELTGDWMRLRLGLIPKKRPQINEATVVGNVRLSQLSPTPTDVPLLITGEMLQLRTDSLNRAVVDVNGAPARVHVQGLLLEGSNLHVSQRENRLWADGPGRMKIPTQGKFSLPGAAPAAAAAPATPPAPGENGPPAPNTPAWITWQGGMDFDGQVVRIARQVEVRGIRTSKLGERQHVLSVGDQLSATLNRYVAFEKAKNTADLDLVEMQFRGDVFTEIQTFNVEDVITSHDRIKTRDMVLDRRTGRFHAAGPGWISSTRYDTGKLGGSLPGSSTGRDARSNWTRAGTSRLIYLRVDYQNEIEGNIDKREAVLQHYVRAVYGPVQSWDQTLDPDQRGGLGPQGIIMTCQRLFVAETGQESQRGLEMSAVGSTVVEGSTFTARAERFSYVQAKDQLVLDGGNGLAQLQKQGRPGQSPTEFSARQIKYSVDTGDVEVFGATELDFTHVGSPDVPKARIR